MADSRDRFFIVSHGPVKQLTCTVCTWSVPLPDEPGAYDRLRDNHRCKGAADTVGNAGP